MNRMTIEGLAVVAAVGLAGCSDAADTEVQFPDVNVPSVSVPSVDVPETIGPTSNG